MSLSKYSYNVREEPFFPLFFHYYRFFYLFVLFLAFSFFFRNVSQTNKFDYAQFILTHLPWSMFTQLRGWKVFFFSNERTHSFRIEKLF
jgi:hypothetical protein